METEELTPPTDPPAEDANYEAFKIEILKVGHQLKIRGMATAKPTKIMQNFIDTAARRCSEAIVK